MTAQVRSELLDDLMEVYVEWREECVSLYQAYERWTSSPVDERDLAFAAYSAALDREQQASAVYSDRIEVVEREIASRQGPLRRLLRRNRDYELDELELEEFGW